MKSKILSKYGARYGNKALSVTEINNILKSMNMYNSFPMKINGFRSLLNILNIKPKSKVIYKFFKMFDIKNSGQI